MARFNQPTLLSLLGLFLGLLSQSNAAPAPRVARDVDVESESYQRHRPPGFHHGYPPFPPTLKVREESAEGSVVDNADAPSGWFYKHSLDDSVSEDKIDSTDAENGRKAVFLNYREPLERRGWFYEHSLDDSAEEQKTDSTDVEDGGPRPIADYATYRLDPPSPRALAARSEDQIEEDEHHHHHPPPPHHPPTLAARSEDEIESDEHHHHNHHPPTLAVRSEDDIEEDEHHHHHHHHPPPPHHPPTLATREDDKTEEDEHHRHHHHHPLTLVLRSEDETEEDEHRHHHHRPPPPHHPPTLAVRSEDEIEEDEHHHHHHHHHPPTLAVRSEEEVSTDYPGRAPIPGWRPVPIEFPSGPGNLEARNDKEDLKWPPPPPPGIGYPPKDKAVAGASDDDQEINARGEDDAQDPEFYIPPNCHEYGCPP